MWQTAIYSDEFQPTIMPGSYFWGMNAIITKHDSEMQFVNLEEIVRSWHTFKVPMKPFLLLFSPQLNLYLHKQNLPSLYPPVQRLHILFAVHVKIWYLNMRHQIKQQDYLEDKWGNEFSKLPNSSSLSIKFLLQSNLASEYVSDPTGHLS